MRSFSALVVAAVAASVSGLQITPHDIPVRSRLGQRLMSEARALGNNNNNNYDFSWAVDYSLKYEGCATLVQYNGGNGNNKNNNNNKNGYGLISSQTIVKVSLCPTSGSGYCGEYVVPMANFVQQWTEALMNAKEYACEMIRQNCNCENANDDQACEKQCYYSAGRDDCIEVEEENEQDFELERYLECREMENKNNKNGNNNNNNNGNNYYSDDANYAYYVGPYCASDGYSIHLGTFTDQYCSSANRVSKEAVFYNRYGFELPYSSKAIIAKESISCEYQNNKNNNNNNNNNNNQQAEPSQLCQEVYQSAAKCEKNLSIDYPDTTGCQFIDYILPRLSYTGRVSSQESSVLRGGSRASRMFAWIFALSTIVLGAYSFFLYRKINRSKVDLSHSADAAMT